MGLSEHPLNGKTTRTLLVMVAVLAIPHVFPKLSPLRIAHFSWETSVSADDERPAAMSLQPPLPASGEQELPASENTPTINNALPSDAHAALPEVDGIVRGTLREVPVEDRTGHALDAFFTRLGRTDRREPGAVTRILHYGDSTVASDYISGTARRRLQARFGDAGHGFILIANPWQW